MTLRLCFDRAMQIYSGYVLEARETFDGREVQMRVFHTRKDGERLGFDIVSETSPWLEVSNLNENELTHTLTRTLGNMLHRHPLKPPFDQNQIVVKRKTKAPGVNKGKGIKAVQLPTLSEPGDAPDKLNDDEKALLKLAGIPSSSFGMLNDYERSMLNMRAAYGPVQSWFKDAIPMTRKAAWGNNPPAAADDEISKAKDILDKIYKDKDEPISKSATKARIRILSSLVRLGATLDVTSHKNMLHPNAVVIVSGFPVHMGCGGGLGFFWPFFSAYGNTLAASMWSSKLLQEQLEALGLPVVHIDILNVAMLYNAHDDAVEWNARTELDKEIELMAKDVVDGDFRQILAQGHLASDAISKHLLKKNLNVKEDRNSVFGIDRKHPVIITPKTLFVSMFHPQMQLVSWSGELMAKILGRNVDKFVVLMAHGLGLSIPNGGTFGSQEGLVILDAQTRSGHMLRTATMVEFLVELRTMELIEKKAFLIEELPEVIRQLGQRVLEMTQAQAHAFKAKDPKRCVCLGSRTCC